MLKLNLRISPAELLFDRSSLPIRCKSFKAGFGNVSPKNMATSPSKEDLLNLPGVAKEIDPVTKNFTFQQTMLRVKDLERSLDFYTRILGFTVLEKLDFAEAKFSLVFLGQYSHDDIPEDPTDRVEWMFSRPNCLELTYNWGSEKSPKEPLYYNGNDDEEKQGYGHIGFNVPDVEAACKRFEELGVQFVKKPNDGRMKGLAFIKDPDNYWIEILNSKASRALLE